MPIPPDALFLDAATGLSNRRHFDVLYDFAFHLAHRGVPISLVFLELASFSAYREEEGDEAAAEAIAEFGRCLGDSTRVMDLAVRLEEARFAAMLMDCNLHGGLLYADRIRDAAVKLSERTGLEVCAGVATFLPSMTTPIELIEVAQSTLALAVASDGERVKVPADLRVPPEPEARSESGGSEAGKSTGS